MSWLPEETIQESPTSPGPDDVPVLFAIHEIVHQAIPLQNMP